MKKFIAIVTAALLSTAAIAGDDTEKSMTTTTFDSLDKNADQQVSKTEAAADKVVSDRFSSLDTNGDGYLNKAEYSVARSKS